MTYEDTEWVAGRDMAFRKAIFVGLKKLAKTVLSAALAGAEPSKTEESEKRLASAILQESSYEGGLTTSVAAYLAADGFSKETSDPDLQAAINENKEAFARGTPEITRA